MRRLHWPSDRRQRGGVRRADDRQGQGTRHVADGVPQCLRLPIRSRSLPRARHGRAGEGAAGKLSAVLSLLLDHELHLRRPDLGTINGILSRYAGADGIKTGFTCGSGYNLVASAKRNGRRLIGVLLGSRTNFERHSEMGRLLDVGFATDPQALDGKVKAGGTRNLRRRGRPGAADPAVHRRVRLRGERDLDRGRPDGHRPRGRLGPHLRRLVQQGAGAAPPGQARQQLKPVLAGGRAVILPKQWEGVRRYSALLAGLSEEQAGKACKHLWSVGTYCLALSPQVLRNPQAVWR